MTAVPSKADVNGSFVFDLNPRKKDIDLRVEYFRVSRLERWTFQSWDYPPQVCDAVGAPEKRFACRSLSHDAKRN